MDLWWLREHYPVQTSQSQPIYAAREGNNLILAPYPDSAYTYGGIYYGRLPSLSATNTTNWITSKNPDLIMAGSMLEAATFLADTTAVQYWTQRFDALVQAVQQADDRERYSGSPLAMRAG